MTLKTQPNTANVFDFIQRVENKRRRADAENLLALFNEVTGAKPVMWGDSIVGYGRYDYTYRSGHSGTWLITGFSPRKQNMVVYLMCGFEGFEHLFADLGKYKLGKSCVYINKLADVNLVVLAKLIRASVSKTLSLYDGEIT